MTVAVPSGNAFDAGVPRALFDARVPLTGSPYRTTYTATADGRRFLVNTRTDDVPMPINIVFPWTSLLKR